MNLLLVGCGNIGGALLKLWSMHQTFDHVLVVEPTKQHAREYQDKVQFVESCSSIPDGFKPSIVVLAIKPQTLKDCMPALIPHIKDAIVVSVLAGVTTQTIESIKVVRLMPNLAIRTGQSVNLAFANSQVTKEDIRLVDEVFELTGRMIWLDREELIDTLTPVSGCGPAYFFLLAELLVQETTKLGLDEELARSIVQQTLLGSATLVQDVNDFEGLIANVSSKGGVTEAAIKMMRPGFEGTINKSMEAAFTRLKELSSK